MLLLVVCFIGHSEAFSVVRKSGEELRREFYAKTSTLVCTTIVAALAEIRREKSFATFVLCKICKQSTLSLEKTSASAFLQLNLSSAKYCTENKLDNF